MYLSKYYVGIVAGLACSVSAADLVPLVDFIPECKQSEVVSQQKMVRVALDSAARYSAARDIPEIASYLQQMRESATAQGFDAVLVQKLAKRQHTTSRGVAEIAIELEMFRFCAGNDALSDRLADNTAERKIVMNMGTLTVKTGFKTEITVRPAESDYKTLTPQTMNVSLSDGAMGLKLGMTEAQLRAAWGSPSAVFLQSDGTWLLGYGRRLWVLLDPTVKRVFTDSEILSGVGRNLLEFHPEFDEKPWLVDGHTAYRTNALAAGLKLGAWQKVSPLQWRQQAAGAQISLVFEEFNPHSAAQTTALLTGFSLNRTGDKTPPVVLREAEFAKVLAFVESVSTRDLQQQPKATLLATELRHHQLVQRRNLSWYLVTEQLHVLLKQDDVSRIKLTAPVLSKSKYPDQWPALLKALKIPPSKAGLRQAFPDIQDYGDRFQLYRADYSIQIEFSSDEEQATIDQLEIIYNFPS